MLSNLRAPIVAFLALLVSLFAPVAMAAVDVAATTAELGDVKDAVVAIGVAVLAIFLGIKLYKWIKSAL